MSSLAGANRASYNRVNPNMPVGRKPERASVDYIGVFNPLTKALLFKLPFTRSSIRTICLCNLDFNQLQTACDLATGQTIVGNYADSSRGLPMQHVAFRAIK